MDSGGWKGTLGFGVRGSSVVAAGEVVLDMSVASWGATGKKIGGLASLRRRGWKLYRVVSTAEGGQRHRDRDRDTEMPYTWTVRLNLFFLARRRNASPRVSHDLRCTGQFWYKMKDQSATRNEPREQ